MLDKKITNELGNQRILPILNTTELQNVISRLEIFLSNN